MYDDCYQTELHEEEFSLDKVYLFIIIKWGIKRCKKYILNSKQFNTKTINKNHGGKYYNHNYRHVGRHDHHTGRESTALHDRQHLCCSEVPLYLGWK